MSIRIAQWIVPAAALALFETRGRPAVWVMAVVLIGLAIALRWHSRAGGQDVNIGLQSGLLPMLVGLSLCHIGCPTFAVFSPYGGLCVVLGGISGLRIGVQARSVPDYTLWRWGTTVGVATLITGLGCSTLGIGNVLGIAIGMAASSAAVPRVVSCN
jgi:hypothetical protein